MTTGHSTVSHVTSQGLREKSPAAPAATLFEALALGNLLEDSGALGELDSATNREILAEVAGFAQGPVAESFVASGRTPPVFLPDERTIAVPDPIRKAVQAIWDAEW